MNTTTNSPQNALEEQTTKERSPLIKRPWFITLLIILAILLGFLVLFLCLKNNTDSLTSSITFGDININIEIIDKEGQSDKAIISSSLIEHIEENTNVVINWIEENVCIINGPIYINNNHIDNIEATVIQTSEQIFKISKEYIVSIFDPTIVDDVLSEITKNGDISIQDKRIIAIYFVVICLITYLVSIFAFKNTVVVTYNNLDKYILIIAGILIAIYVFFVNDYGDTEFMMWVKHIAIACGIATLLFTIVGNFPNPLYIFLGLMAKVFVVGFIAVVVMLIIIALIMTIIFTMMASSKSESSSNSESWEISYDEYLDKFIATRRW